MTARQNMSKEFESKLKINISRKFFEDSRQKFTVAEQ